MKKLCTIAVAAGFAGLVFACNSAPDNVKDTDSANAHRSDSMSNQASVTDSSNAVPSKQDAEFMTKAASGGMLEVQLGQLAQTHGSSQRVKDFGAMMIKDHTRAGEELKSLAKGKRILLPDSISNDQMKMRDDLAKKSGTAFDRDYMKMMVDDHKEDVSAFDKASKNCNDPDIKAFAGNTLGTLRQHLDSAQVVHAAVKK